MKHCLVKSFPGHVGAEAVAAFMACVQVEAGAAACVCPCCGHICTAEKL